MTNSQKKQPPWNIHFDQIVQGPPAFSPVVFSSAETWSEALDASGIMQLLCNNQTREERPVQETQLQRTNGLNMGAGRPEEASGAGSVRREPEDAVL